MKKILTFSLILFSLSLAAQFETGRGPVTEPKSHGLTLKWNNAASFKDQPKPKFFNWKTYPKTLDGKQLSTWGVFVASGMMHGAREAYHAQPTVFETRFDVGSESFWGSEAWKRNYVDNDPDKAHKHEYFGNVGRDVWHTFGFASNALLFSGTFIIGARKQPIKYRVANALLGWGARSLAASLTYNALR